MSQVYALVAGSQANQDGRSASITAPNGFGLRVKVEAKGLKVSIYGLGVSIGVSTLNFQANVLRLRF